MLIIKEVEYAVMILDELYHESPLSAAALSTRRNIPSPFIYRVLKKLEARDILEIRRGPKGGYSLKADCEKLKKNLGRIIRQKSIELIKKAFPEIEQEKLASKIKKLDEVARQNFTMNPGNEDKQY